MSKKTTIEFSARMTEAINDLISHHGSASMADVVRNAIGLYYIAKREQKNGNIICIVNKNGEIIKEISLSV